jgi:hypothetical protein
VIIWSGPLTHETGGQWPADMWPRLSCQWATALFSSLDLRVSGSLPFVVIAEAPDLFLSAPVGGGTV